MFQIGPSLREARTRRGFSPADVHKAIRIRERYLTALEEEHWEMLPGDAYTKGFLRTYAEFLGLDGQLYIDEYNARIAQHEEEPLVPETMKKHGRAGGSSSARSAPCSSSGPSSAASPPGATPAPRPARRSTQRQRPRSRPPSSRESTTSRPRSTGEAGRHAEGDVHRDPRRADRSWLSVRLGGPNGKELFRGNLEPGHFLKYGLHQPVWVRMGRPLALDIRIGKKLGRGAAGRSGERAADERPGAKR